MVSCLSANHVYSSNAHSHTYERLMCHEIDADQLNCMDMPFGALLQDTFQATCIPERRKD